MQARDFVKMLSPERDSNVRPKRSVGYSNAFWENASTVTFSFMDDVPDELAYRIEMAMRQWEPFVSLAFELVENGKGQIRIALGGTANYSAIGTNALRMAAQEPTMAIGLDPASPYFEATVIHEFGHALGFHHAHLHSDANIQWNKPAVYAFYNKEVNWDEEEVDLNLFGIESGSTVLQGEYDRHSIMHYAIPGFLTLNDAWFAFNTKLSEGDKRFARKVYPAIDYRADPI